jgi:hypothetical protein
MAKCTREAIAESDRPLRVETQRLRRLQASGRPALLTVRGRAWLVVQATEAYEKTLERVECILVCHEPRRGAEGRNRTSLMGSLLKQVAAIYGSALSRLGK